MKSKPFQLQDGKEAVHAIDKEWLQPDQNPFGHGCCDCGLFHDVEYRIVDRDGNIVCEGNSQKFGIQLSFTRNPEETERLREHQKSVLAQQHDNNFLAVTRILDRECPEPTVATFMGIDVTMFPPHYWAKICKYVETGYGVAAFRMGNKS